MKYIVWIFIASILVSVSLQSPKSKRSPKNSENSLFGQRDEDHDNEGGAVEAPKTHKSKETLGFLPLPPGYNKLVIPLGNVTKSMFIMVHLSIREILDVDTANGILEMDTELGITWIDWEIWKYFMEDKEAQEKAKKGGEEEITLDAEFLKSIWKPDIFIEEMASVERTFLLSKLITLRFLVRNAIMPGAITFKSRQTFKVRCEMDFHYYPADTQNCPFKIRSYTYPEDKLFLVWNPTQRIFLDQIEDSNYDFQVSDVEPGGELYDLFTTTQDNCCSHQNYSTLAFNIQVRRNMTYHLVQTCLPSVLLILITWLCFLLPPDMVEVRIGISMTTLLTLTAMFTAVREQSPDVSYTMAIDIWMIFCCFFIFVALVLFTVIYWMRRRLDKSHEITKADIVISENGDLPNATEEIVETKTYIKIMRHSKKYAFVVFAIVFILFLILFATWLLTASGYLDWNPSEKYNALPLEDEDDESNRLFTKQETKFKASQKKKVIKSQYRFNDIFKQVIYPKLQELEGSEEYEEEDVDATTEGVVEATTIGPGGTL